MGRKVAREICERMAAAGKIAATCRRTTRHSDTPAFTLRSIAKWDEGRDPTFLACLIISRRLKLFRVQILLFVDLTHRDSALVSSLLAIDSSTALISDYRGWRHWQSSSARLFGFVAGRYNDLVLPDRRPGGRVNPGMSACVQRVQARRLASNLDDDGKMTMIVSAYLVMFCWV